MINTSSTVGGRGGCKNNSSGCGRRGGCGQSRGQGYYNAMEEGSKPRMMAKTILNNIKLDEIWGNEISLEYENKFYEFR